MWKIIDRLFGTKEKVFPKILFLIQSILINHFIKWLEPSKGYWLFRRLFRWFEERFIQWYSRTKKKIWFYDFKRWRNSSFHKNFRLFWLSRRLVMCIRRKNERNIIRYCKASQRSSWFRNVIRCWENQRRVD